MAKKNHARRGAFNADDVIADRVRPGAADLIALIRDVNPTGRGLKGTEAARRYALKSRLQSILVVRFQDAIEIHTEPIEPGVVSLRHRPSGVDACHAVIAELEDEARSIVQRAVDLGSQPELSSEAGAGAGPATGTATAPTTATAATETETAPITGTAATETGPAPTTGTTATGTGTETETVRAMTAPGTAMAATSARASREAVTALTGC